MLPSTAVIIRSLRLGYNKSNNKHIFCNKPFKAFLESQTSTALLAIKNLLF